MHKIDHKAVLAGPGEAAQHRCLGQGEPMQKTPRAGPFGAGEAQEEGADPRDEWLKIHGHCRFCGEADEAQKGRVEGRAGQDVAGRHDGRAEGGQGRRWQA